MARTKVTFVFNYGSNASLPAAPHRTAGITESYVWPDDINAATFNAATALANLRAQLLPTGSQISLIRFNALEPKGPSWAINRVFAGGSNLLADTPQTALHCRCGSADKLNTRSIDLRLIPDAIVVEGEKIANRAFDTALSQFATGLNGWQFYGVDKTQQQFKIVSIDATGQVHLQVAAGLLVNGNMIHVSRAMTAYGTFVNGDYQIVSGAGTAVLVLRNWPAIATTGGTLKLVAKTWITLSSTSFAPVQIIEKKVGVPSNRYRGKRSKKRKLPVA